MDPFIDASRHQRRGCGWPPFRNALQLDGELLELLDGYMAADIATTGVTHAAILTVLDNHGATRIPSKKVIEVHRNGGCSCD